MVGGNILGDPMESQLPEVIVLGTSRDFEAILQAIRELKSMVLIQFWGQPQIDRISRQVVKPNYFIVVRPKGGHWFRFENNKTRVKNSAENT